MRVNYRNSEEVFGRRKKAVENMKAQFAKTSSTPYELRPEALPCSMFLTTKKRRSKHMRRGFMIL
jgi:hypothetical protein